jgi:hypothetical protein
MKKPAENLEYHYKTRLTEGCLKMIEDILANIKLEDVVNPAGKVLVINITAKKYPPYNEAIQLEDALDYETEEWENCVADIVNEYFGENGEGLTEGAVEISVGIADEDNSDDEVPEDVKELIRNELKNIKAKLLN